ncbi:MAG: hypothetical protein ACYCVH_15420 [Ignavibacteriaceae bacterium]
MAKLYLLSGVISEKLGDTFCPRHFMKKYNLGEGDFTLKLQEENIKIT